MRKRKYKVPRICRYCGGRVILTPTSAVYGNGNDNIYLCTNCNAYVGCHRGTNKPLGKLANTVLRLKRQETHVVFDGFWRAQGWTRKQAYAWLARAMRLDADDAHIACFEMDDCEQAIELCRHYKPAEKKEAT